MILHYTNIICDAMYFVNGGVFSNMLDFLHAVGYFGEFVSFIIVCILLRAHHVYLGVYLLMLPLVKLVNSWLKTSFRHDRPSRPVKFLESDAFSKTKYGMPSGHAQLTFFSVAYLFLLSSFAQWILALAVAVCAAVAYQRVVYRNHHLSQIAAGAVTGAVLAYAAAKVARYANARMHSSTRIHGYGFPSGPK